MQKVKQGHKVVLGWLELDKMSLLNKYDTHTRFDHRTKQGSTLDICLVSKSVEKAVQSLKEDTDRNWWPFAVQQKPNGSLEKKFSDHVAIKVNVVLPIATVRKKSSVVVIDFQKPGGWEEYVKASNEAAVLIKEVAEDLSLNIDKVKEKIDLINKELHISSFGLKWRKQGGRLTKKSRQKILNM